MTSLSVDLYQGFTTASEIYINGMTRKFSNCVLGGTVVLFALTFLYAVYRSRISASGEMTVWYVISCIGVIVYAFVLTRSEATKANFALITLSGICGLYFVELALLTWEKITQPVSYGMYDKTRKYQEVQRFRSKSVDAYPNVFPSLFIKSDGLIAGENKIYPLGGISQKTTVYCNEGGEYTIYQSDEHGFNNPLGLYRKGDVDLLIVGDSFAQGACVKPEEGMAIQLSKMGNTVLTLGSDSNGPLIELASIKEYAEPLEPRVVIWLYYEGNDLENLLAEKESSLLKKYLDSTYSQNLIERQLEIDEILVNFVQEESNRMKDETFFEHFIQSDWAGAIRLFQIRKKIKTLFFNPIPRPFSLFEEILKQAKTRVSILGGELYFVYLPAFQRYREDFNGDLYREEVLSIVRELEIPIIDFHEVFVSHPDKFSLFPFGRAGGHYTAEGYRLLAEKIQRRIENHKKSDFYVHSTVKTARRTKGIYGNESN